MIRALLLLLAILYPALAAAHGNPSVLHEWRFRGDRDLAGWTPNAEVRGWRIEESGLSFSTTGSDPILEYRNPFQVEAAVHQAIEIRLAADRDGEFEVFWSGTTEGRFGGFSGEKRTSFRVRGDGEWRTYRVFPFWHREGRIRRIRLDPFAGASFRLAMVRIIGWEVPSSGNRFDLKSQPWLPLEDASWQPLGQGARIELLGPSGFALSPLLRSSSLERPVLHLRIVSRRARRASVLFATGSAHGPQEMGFELIADGRPHSYNLDMLGAPAWNGEILAVGLRPGEIPGDEIELLSAALSERPLGPAEVRVLSFGAEETLPRAGRAFRMSLRVANAGGAAASVEVLGKGAARRLEPGEEAEFAWPVRFAKPGAYRVSAKVRTDDRTLDVSATVRVTAAPPKALADPLRVTPVLGSIRVGAYYFPGWRSAGQWSPITRFPERRPALGWYKEGSVEAANWHLKWAAEHGISFFVYDWYWSKGARQLEHGLEAYLKSPNRKYVQFCLLWANHNAPGTSSLADCLAVSDHWIERYFRRPEHLRLGGKPLVVIFSPHRLREDLGSERVSTALDAMRDRCRKAGTGGLAIAACVGSAGEAEICAREGYDIVTAYTWPSLGMEGAGRRAPFSGLIGGYQAQWEAIAERSVIPMLLPICGGWDSRPWHGESALVRFGRTPAAFRKHLESARGFLSQAPPKALPIALVEAWNEWGEGSYIEPHREHGFAYLDAIRDVFFGPSKHIDATPRDAGQDVAQVSFQSLSTSAWTFSSGIHGWESGMNISEPAIASGALQFETGDADSALFSPPLLLNAGDFRRLRFRISLAASGEGPKSDMAQLFWSTKSAAESEAASVRFPVILDGAERVAEVELASNPRWRGVLTRLRFDPCGRAGVRVRIRSVELLP